MVGSESLLSSWFSVIMRIAAGHNGLVPPCGREFLRQWGLSTRSPAACLAPETKAETAQFDRKAGPCPFGALDLVSRRLTRKIHSAGKPPDRPYRNSIPLRFQSSRNSIDNVLSGRSILRCPRRNVNNRSASASLAQTIGPTIFTANILAILAASIASTRICAYRVAALFTRAATQPNWVSTRRKSDSTSASTLTSACIDSARPPPLVISRTNSSAASRPFK